MTSDAKIGLLLGLVFIFIIAFVVNGLPDFLRGGKPSNDLTTEVVKVGGAAPIAQRERMASQDVMELPGGRITASQAQVASSQSAGSEGQQSTTALRSTEPTVSAEKMTNIVSVGPTTIDSNGSTSLKMSGSTATAANNPASPIKSAQPQLKTYVVSENDSLASIAKKFYGEEEGNKKANIEKIFEANRSILKSPDEIYIGQKLVIPSLVQTGTDKKGSKSVADNPMLEKVPSVGQRHIEPKQETSVKKTAEKAESSYVVVEGDNLWKIAAEKLGNGNRYKEIVSLNRNILADEDTVAVGMRLKLPAK